MYCYKTLADFTVMDEPDSSRTLNVLHSAFDVIRKEGGADDKQTLFRQLAEVDGVRWIVFVTQQSCLTSCVHYSGLFES